MTEKVAAKPAALALLAEIVAKHGSVMFSQFGECCDGASPMCYLVWLWRHRRGLSDPKTIDKPLC